MQIKVGFQINLYNLYFIFQFNNYNIILSSLRTVILPSFFRYGNMQFDKLTKTKTVENMLGAVSTTIQSAKSCIYLPFVVFWLILLSHDKKRL